MLGNAALLVTIKQAVKNGCGQFTGGSVLLP